jgi:hypothetical protein
MGRDGVFDQDHMAESCVPAGEDNFTVGYCIDGLPMVPITQTGNVPVFTGVVRIAVSAPIQKPVACDGPAPTMRISHGEVKPIG